MYVRKKVGVEIVGINILKEYFKLIERVVLGNFEVFFDERI